MATLFLIRHGEPELRGVFLGQLDSPLSAAGREHVARNLSEIHAAVTWHSTLLRACQTAESVHSPQRIGLPDLREIDYGAWTGKTWSDIQAQWPEIARQKSADWLHVPPPGGERWPDFQARIDRAWQFIRRGPSPPAIVAHQAVNAALYHLICNGDPLVFRQHYGEMIRVEYD